MFVNRIRDSLPFRAKRPALNRTLAVFLVSLFLNVFATFGLIFVGASLAGLLTGVACIAG